mmetsp:Transcript_76109/g.182030  ORF Transcript_76109/g.182030 Transcript_76109/m.182030 type:complete len:389 (+) Transcript_76109:744-1910(+)
MLSLAPLAFCRPSILASTASGWSLSSGTSLFCSSAGTSLPSVSSSLTGSGSSNSSPEASLSSYSSSKFFVEAVTSSRISSRGFSSSVCATRLVFSAFGRMSNISLRPCSMSGSRTVMAMYSSSAVADSTSCSCTFARSSENFSARFCPPVSMLSSSGRSSSACSSEEHHFLIEARRPVFSVFSAQIFLRRREVSTSTRLSWMAALRKPGCSCPFRPSFPVVSGSSTWESSHTSDQGMIPSLAASKYRSSASVMVACSVSRDDCLRELMSRVCAATSSFTFSRSMPMKSKIHLSGVVRSSTAVTYMILFKTELLITPFITPSTNKKCMAVQGTSIRALGIPAASRGAQLDCRMRPTKSTFWHAMLVNSNRSKTFLSRASKGLMALITRE